MPHVRGLEILNDCEENQKLMLKVPDWLASRWNRQVTVALMDGRAFPTFKDFASFVSLEAEIAFNPSLHYMPFTQPTKGKAQRNSEEIRLMYSASKQLQTVINQ